MRAYLQMQTNAKYASIARPSAKLFHSTLSLELQAQGEARHVADEQSVSERNFSCRAQELGRCPPLASRNSAPQSAKCMSAQTHSPVDGRGAVHGPPLVRGSEDWACSPVSPFLQAGQKTGAWGRCRTDSPVSKEPCWQGVGGEGMCLGDEKAGGIRPIKPGWSWVSWVRLRFSRSGQGRRLCVSNPLPQDRMPGCGQSKDRTLGSQTLMKSVEPGDSLVPLKAAPQPSLERVSRAWLLLKMSCQSSKILQGTGYTHKLVQACFRKSWMRGRSFSSAHLWKD